MSKGRDFHRPVFCKNCGWAGLNGALLVVTTASSMRDSLRCPKCESPRFKYLENTGAPLGRRIEMTMLLAALRLGNEEPGDTIIRALRLTLIQKQKEQRGKSLAQLAMGIDP